MSRGEEKSTARAAAFDIRNVIGLLMALYGVILTAMGLFGDPALAKTGGVNANLYAGLCLLIVGAIFALWAWKRPVVMIEKPTDT
ncbi:hypothetical protein SAMN05421595_0050 [Austwickia chelonae]|uniref:Uncharacterized protein n=2 Tax=Austwickia TaxID=1184606 RepID=K6VQ12_9MICO|nr:hypothetical protein AUCHE_17_00510 [Austwickia chelonae NBRC 105200]SEV85113.1 hypothetical protein SAMN05421595_0050 [Austwickia chelonae]